MAQRVRQSVSARQATRSVENVRVNLQIAAPRIALGICQRECFENLIVEMQKGAGKFDDGFEEEVGLGGAEAFFGGEGAENGDSGPYAGAPSHLQVFWRVAS